MNNNKNIDITFELCGSAGDGVTVLGSLLSLGFARMGYNVFGFNSYPAEIRGFGRCISKTRVSNTKIYSLNLNSDIFVSLNDKHSIGVIEDLKPDGILIFENAPKTIMPEGTHIAGYCEPQQILYGFPIENISQQVSGSARNRNFASLGILTALFNIDYKIMKEVVEERFKSKGKKILDDVLNSFERGYSFTKENIIKVDNIYIEKIKQDSLQKIISGNRAVAMGAMDSGLKLYAGYPITPATPIFEYLIPMLEKAGHSYIQTEDEIAAAGIVIGSFYAGARAMTATSGPGLCLMSEYINFAVMTEQPLVIVDSQRGGPSTGLPTKTEQSDLLYACFGSAGDSPRVVLVPSGIKDCYKFIGWAFYIAEKYQTPVIMLIDFFLSNRMENIKIPEKNNKYLNGNIFPAKKLKGKYKRYKFTKNGISPRALPGTEGFCHPITGLEHNEEGLPDYSGENHLKMLEKRSMKLNGILKEFDLFEIYGKKKTKFDIGIISCGTTAGAAIESINLLSESELNVSVFVLKVLMPLPTDEIQKFIKKCRKIIVVEENYQSQLVKIIRMYVDMNAESLSAVNCEPLHPEDIVDFIKKKTGVTKHRRNGKKRTG